MNIANKIVFTLGLFVLIAAGCNSTDNSLPSAQKTSTSPPPAATAPPNSPSNELPSQVIVQDPLPVQAPVQQNSVNIDISNFSFAPSSISIKKGTKVVWINKDTAAHSVVGDNGGPSSGSLPNSSSYSFIFSQTGTFPYHCGIHPSMKATVTVTE